jgi:hypothetical protein
LPPFDRSPPHSVSRKTPPRGRSRGFCEVGLIEPTQDRATSGTFAAASYRLTIPSDILDVDSPTESIVPARVMRQAPRTSSTSASQLSLLDV